MVTFRNNNGRRNNFRRNDRNFQSSNDRKKFVSNFTNNENEQLMKTADIADMGKKFTTQIICTSK